MIQYASTRGRDQPRSFADVLLAGLAPDGGLYIPDAWPAHDHDFLQNLQGRPYDEVALQIIRPFVGDTISDDVLQNIIAATYQGSVFDHSAVAPLIQAGPNTWILELFHGPTLSFKDYALQLLGRLFDYVLEEKGERITIVGATSGDTGSAAIEACKTCKNIDIFILHPKGRTSDVQRRQMTTVCAPNVHNIALEGTFDDCQAIVKNLFADETLREELNLSAVNSINWARIMAQTVYYFAAAAALGAPDRAVSFTVPTGNFGNIFAGYAARRMGLPIHTLGIATNQNDILTRFFESGAMTIGEVMPSLSPSMDIQVSSNFERYLYDLMDHDHAALCRVMEEFKTRKTFNVGDNLISKAQSEFTARRCSDEQTLTTMKHCYEENGIIIDPHTAVALHGAQDQIAAHPDVPMIVMACAHPAKFPDAAQKAIGFAPPAVPRLAAVMEKEEHYTVLPHDLDEIKSFVQKNVLRKKAA